VDRLLARTGATCHDAMRACKHAHIHNQTSFVNIFIRQILCLPDMAGRLDGAAHFLAEIWS